MADGDGVRGQEVRQVVNTGGPSGRENVPVRQLGQVSVQAPRGGNVNAVGAEQRAMIEIAKMGYSGIEAHLEKKKATDALDGELRYAQGETEEDLKKAGVNRATLGGYQALKAKTGYNEWLAQSMKNIELQDHTLSSEEYQAKLKDDFKGLMNGIDSSNPEMVKMMSGFANEGFTTLVRKHTLQNTQYAAEESQNSITDLIRSEALTGNLESVQELLDNSGALVPGLSDRASQGAVFAAAGSLLDEGNFSVFDQMGGLEGMRERGASEEEIGSMRNKYKTAQSLSETDNMTAIESGFNQIMTASKMGDIGREEADFRTRNLVEGFRATDTYARSMIKMVNAEFNSQELDAETMSRVADPEYIQEKAMILAQAGMVGIEEGQTANKLLRLADKYGIPPDHAKADLERLPGAHDKFVSKQMSKVEAIVKDNEKAQELDRKAGLLLGTDFANMESYSQEEKTRAMNMRRQSIIEEVVQSGEFQTDAQVMKEVTQRHVAFMRDAPLKDNAVMAMFKGAAQASPIGPDGKLDENAEGALNYFMEMRQSGLSEKTIRAYAGDSYDYMRAAEFLQNGSLDVSKAMLSAFEVTQLNQDEAPTPATKVKDVREQVRKDVDDFFDDIEPSMLSSWLGAPSNGKYDEVLTSEVKEAAKNSEPMKQWAEQRAAEYARIYPNMKPDGISKFVQSDLSRWEYVFGSMVAPKNGQSLSEMMGISDLPETLATNSAILHTINTRLEDLVPPESKGVRAIIKKAVQGVKEGLVAPESLVPNYQRNENTIPSSIGQALLFPLNSLEYRQKLLKNLKPIDVTPYGNDIVLITIYEDADKTKPIGTPIPLNAKMIGADYRNRLK